MAVQNIQLWLHKPADGSEVFAGRLCECIDPTIKTARCVFIRIIEDPVLVPSLAPSKIVTRKTHRCAVMLRQGYAVESAETVSTACLGKNPIK
jgi:hypothetical protein